MSNNFLQFDSSKANMLTDGDYSSSSYRTGGAASGIAPSNVHNKLFYQVSTFVAAFGKMMSDKGLTASDADLNTLATTLAGLWLASEGQAYVDARVLKYVRAWEQQASGVAGGTLAQGSWVKRPINQISSEVAGTSLASNQITLPAGSWYCHATCPTCQVGDHKARLYNVTDSTTLLVGTTMRGSASVGSVTTASVVSGIFTLASPKVFRFEHQCTNTNSDEGFGRASGFSEVEIYAIAEFWRRSA